MAGTRPQHQPAPRQPRPANQHLQGDSSDSRPSGHNPRQRHHSPDQDLNNHAQERKRRGVSADTVALSATIDLEALTAQIEERLIERLQIHGPSPWMDIKAAADYLNWPQKRLYTLTSAKGIPHRKHGNRLLFNRHELDTWLNNHYEGPPGYGP
jgi:excisionase family DNA binding protein